MDLTACARNVANVKAWCQSNPKETVMAGLERAIGTSILALFFLAAGPALAQDRPSGPPSASVVAIANRVGMKAVSGFAAAALGEALAIGLTTHAQAAHRRKRDSRSGRTAAQDQGPAFSEPWSELGDGQLPLLFGHCDFRVGWLPGLFSVPASGCGACRSWGG